MAAAGLSSLIVGRSIIAGYRITPEVTL